MGDILTNIVWEIIKALNNGSRFVQDHALKLTMLLATIDFIIFGIYLAMGKNASIESIVEKIFQIGIFIFLILNVRRLAFVFEKSVVQIAGMVGSNFKIEMYLTNPGYIIENAHNVVLAPINKLIEESGGFFPRVDLIVTNGFCYLVMQICFIAMAVQVALSIVEFHITLYMSMVLIPFIVFEPMRFIGIKTFPAIMGAAIKLGMSALIIGLSMYLLNMYVSLPNANAFNVAFLFQLVAMCVLLLFLSLQIPNLAASLLSGVPSLSATGFMNHAASLGRSAFSAYNSAKNIPNKISQTKDSIQGTVKSAQDGMNRMKFNANKLFRKGEK